jgi:hypothetical protein
MTIFEIPSKRNARERTYKWFKEWIVTLETEMLEKLLKFITGSTRIPPKKIIVCNSYLLNAFY